MTDKKPTFKFLKSEIQRVRSITEDFNPQKELGQTRSAIAKQFVTWYFRIIIWGFILTLAYNVLIFWLFSSQKEHIIVPKDILLTITGIIGSPLGFVVGYYFKDIEK